METSTTTEIMKHESIWEMVRKYEEAQKCVVSAYVLLLKGQENLRALTKYPQVIYSSNRTQSVDERDCGYVLKQMKRDAWEGVLKKTQAESFMTASRYKAFQKDLENPDSLPEITFESIRGFVENILNAAPDMLMEFIKETFEWLKPGTFTMHYKTNQKSKYELTEKIIKSSCMSHGYPNMHVNYYLTSTIKAMDNAFSLMDGKGTIKPGLDSVSIINEAANNAKQRAETDYFDYKWYKNGNLHIQFKRPDLLARMNQIAGDNLVKPGVAA